MRLFKILRFSVTFFFCFEPSASLNFTLADRNVITLTEILLDLVTIGINLDAL
jgi:hypothetical protein